VLKAQNPPMSSFELMNQLGHHRVSQGVTCVQQGRKFEWCVTFNDANYVEMVEMFFNEEENKDIIAVKLKANELGQCTLEGVPFEFSNVNIMAQLEQYFEEVTIEDQVHKNVPEGMGLIYTGTQIFRYKNMKKPPPTKLNLGRGVFGWLNNINKEDSTR